MCFVRTTHTGKSNSIQPPAQLARWHVTDLTLRPGFQEPWLVSWGITHPAARYPAQTSLSEQRHRRHRHRARPAHVLLSGDGEGEGEGRAQSLATGRRRRKRGGGGHTPVSVGWLKQGGLWAVLAVAAFDTDALAISRVLFHIRCAWLPVGLGTALAWLAWLLKRRILESLNLSSIK